MRRSVVIIFTLVLTGLFQVHADILSCNIQGPPHNQGPILFTNVNVFDGKTNKIFRNARVLVDYVRSPDGIAYDGSIIKGSDIGYFIKEISLSGVLSTPYDASKVRNIDGNGLTLMPGLIDSHSHLSWADIKPFLQFASKVQAGVATFADWPSTGVDASLNEAKNRLMDGFTTIRETGGLAHRIKKCIDPSISGTEHIAYEGVIGPRIIYAGSVISPTSGHADIESELDEKFHFISPVENMTASQREDLVLQADAFGVYKADGVSETSKAVRAQFAKGAQFIKIATGGGIVSPHDPIDGTIMTDDEVAAVTEITDGMNTYTTTHAYEGETILRDVRHGVQMIEHANLINEDAIRLVKSKQNKRELYPSRNTSVLLNISPFFQNQYDGSSALSGYNLDKLRIVEASTLNAYALAKKYKLRNIGWGSDVLFLPGGASIAPLMLANMPIDLAPLKNFKIQGSKKYGNYSYSNYDIIKMATYNNGLIVTKSGPRTPYLGVDGSYLRDGLIGYIGPNAVADLILVNGNPLDDLSFLKDAASNIKLIMKDGIIYKNTLRH